MNRLSKFTLIIALSLMVSFVHTMEPEEQSSYERNCYEHSSDSTEENSQERQKLLDLLTPNFPSDDQRNLSIVTPVKLYMKNTQSVDFAIVLTPLATSMLIPYCIDQFRKDQFVSSVINARTNRSGRKVFCFEVRQWFMERQFCEKLREKRASIASIVFKNYSAQWELNENDDYITKVRCFYSCIFHDANEPNYELRMTTFSNTADHDNIVDIQFDQNFNGALSFAKSASNNGGPAFTITSIPPTGESKKINIRDIRS